jgi:2-haloacid dehalogenase
VDFDRFTHLSFDCYGTLIDWETGILTAVMPVLCSHAVEAGEAEVLRLYAQLEARQESGPYRSYRDVLRTVMSELGTAFGLTLSEAELEVLPESLSGWPPFPDTTDALQRLAARFKLAILSNVDDTLFAGTNRRLGVAFDAVVTAEQVGSYKPSLANFQALLARLDAAPDQVLHVAQSLYHDHVPAKALGFRTVWVNRPSRLPGTGLSLCTRAAPDLDVPDLATLAAILKV